MTKISFHEYSFSRLMLGTVQFGLPYGVANSQGQPSLREVIDILECAHAGGVNCLDTAPFYGQSEKVLGRALHEAGLQEEMLVISKALRDVPENASASDVDKLAEEQVSTSLRRLQLDCLPLCLIHLEDNFRYVDSLLALEEKGWLAHVGCSVTSPESARSVIETGLADAIQLPSNIFDNRFNQEPSVLELAEKNGVAVFVRSAYLQGLLLMSPEDVPNDLTAAIPVLRKLEQLASDWKLSREELALRYVLGLHGVSCVLTGVDSKAQMQRNLQVVSEGELPATLQEAIEEIVPRDLPIDIISPFMWEKRMPDSGVQKKRVK